MTARRFALYLAGAISVYAGLVYWVLKPCHAHEFLQPVLAYLIALDHLLQLPGLIIAQYFRLRVNNHLVVVGWLLSQAINFPIYYWMAMILWEVRQRFFSSQVPAAPGAQPGKTETRSGAASGSRRRFLATGLSILGGGSAAGLAYSLGVEPRWFEVSRRTFFLPGLPPTLDGLRAVQLTDIHHGPWLSLNYVREMVETCNLLEPDLILLTGDYVLESPVYIKPVAEELARLRPRIATLAVLGNHDWWEDAELTRQQLVQNNIQLLDNTRIMVSPDRRLTSPTGEGLAICGVGDLWEDTLDYERALDGLPTAMPRLLLAHNPDTAEVKQFLEGRWRVDLMLSGHTHGGQVHLPGLGRPILPSAYGQKYAEGLIQGPGCLVYVCRGIGVSMLPVRMGVRPEMAVFEFRSVSSRV